MKAKKRVKRRGKDFFEPRKTYVNEWTIIDGKRKRVKALYWQVNFYELVDGKRVRKREVCKDKGVADTKATLARTNFENHGLDYFSISGADRHDALAAKKELQPFPGVSILEAAIFYAKHLAQIQQSEKVSVAVREFLAAREKDGLSRRYRKDLKIRLSRFGRKFGDRTLASLSPGDINDWLRNFAGFHRNTFRAQLSVLFAYAVDRGWCNANPIAKIKKVKAVAKIGILAPEQFAKVLETASEETLPYWLLGGFAGLRRAEVERLEWKDVRFDLAKYQAFKTALATRDKDAIAKAEKEWRSAALIEVPALKSKTASRRFVQIQDNLAAWLEPYIGRTKTEKVCPKDLRNLLETDRLNSGVWTPTQNSIKRSGKDAPVVKSLKPWPSNGLRHSFASYHLAHFQDAARLALELGHTDQELLFRHYRELVTPEQAAKYWDIRPVVQTNLVAISG